MNNIPTAEQIKRWRYEQDWTSTERNVIRDALEAQSAEIDRQVQKYNRLYYLLDEWLEVPFKETKEDWQRWIDEFRPRVEAAAEVEVK